MCVWGLNVVLEVWKYLPLHQDWGSGCWFHCEDHRRLIRHWTENTEKKSEEEKDRRSPVHHITVLLYYAFQIHIILPPLRHQCCQSLTILQGGDSLCLFAEDTVSYIIGGQHPELVWCKRLQPGREDNFSQFQDNYSRELSTSLANKLNDNVQCSDHH